MKTVYKYELSAKDPGDYIKISIPSAAILVCVKEQFGNVCLWAEVDTANETKERLFQVFATGQEQPQQMGIGRAYVGTVFFNCGGLVFHVYEVFN